jgi:hypothetical protein
MAAMAQEPNLVRQGVRLSAIVMLAVFPANGWADDAQRMAFAEYCATAWAAVDPHYSQQSCACLYDGVAKALDADELTFWVAQISSVGKDAGAALETNKPPEWTEAARTKAGNALPGAMKSCGFKVEQ